MRVSLKEKSLNSSNKNRTPGTHMPFRCKKFKKLRERCDSEKRKMCIHLLSHPPGLFKTGATVVVMGNPI